MADGITIDVDTAPLEAALNAFADRALPYVNAGSKVTADAIVEDAKTRLARQLGPNATGKTVAAIHDRPAYDNHGWIVIVERDPMPNLPFWLEKGTKAHGKGGGNMAAHPFFYAAVRLQVEAHERRMRDALHEVIAAEGFGD